MASPASPPGRLSVALSYDRGELIRRATIAARFLDQQNICDDSADCDPAVLPPPPPAPQHSAAETQSQSPDQPQSQSDSHASSSSSDQFSFVPSSFSLTSVLTSFLSVSSGLETQFANLDTAISALRSSIVSGSRRNYLLDRSLLAIDEKIKLLIKNKIEIQEISLRSEVKAADESISQATLKGKKPLFEEFFYCLQSNPIYLARLARLVPASEVPLFVQTVVIDLFGSEYNNREERLLLRLFDHCIAMELENCTDRATLFRSNSAVTQMLSAYAKRGQGLAILKGILQDPIQKVMDKQYWKAQAQSQGRELDLDLELIPSKVALAIKQKFETESGQTWQHSAALAAADEAAIAALPPVAAALERRVSMLTHFTQLILDRILDHVSSFPYGIRYICRSLATHFKHRFPDYTVQQVHSLVGGFIYLRFFSPIIVSPHLCHFISSAPSKVEQRSLILITKVLQNLSNGLLFGDKEQYMKLLNPFIEANLPRIGSYFDSLIELSDSAAFTRFDQFLKLDKFLEHTQSNSASATIQLNTNQLRLMHSLLHQHGAQIAVDPEVTDVLSRLGPAEPFVELKGEENRTHFLTLTKSRDQRFSTAAQSQGAAPSPDAGGSLDPFDLLDFSHFRPAVLSLVHLLPSPFQFSDPSFLDFLSSQASKLQGQPLDASQFNTLQAILRCQETLQQLIHSRLREFRAFRSVQSQAAESSSAWPDEAIISDESLFSNFLLYLLSQSVEVKARAVAHLRDTEALLSQALAAIDQYHSAQLERLELYQQYLENVRQAQFQQSSSKGSTASKDRAEPIKARAPRKFELSHHALEGLGIVSWIAPEIDRKLFKACIYQFEERSAGVISVNLIMKKGPISMNVLGKSLDFVLEDLLKQQTAGSSEIDLEMIRLNLNLFIHLCNKRFATSK